MRILVKSVGYSIGSMTILDQIQHTFTTGVTFVIGRNGAGKSSLLKLLTTVIPPSCGEILFTQSSIQPQLGRHRKVLSIEEVRRLIGYLPQEFTGYPQMTVEQFIKNTAIHKGIPPSRVRSRVEEMITGTRLHSLRKKKLRHLSGGELQKVGLIQAVIHDPPICILDEPFEHLDLEEMLYFRHLLQRLSQHSVVIISTHQIEQIDLLGTADVMVIESGALRASGTVQSLGDLHRFFMV
ncbi:ATP-binding cassette domain-containing protein [Tumebacillus lipolyticus]|uniref:ATP-binding cassette domain-containing protein n=1 Tax=Tumebacillus lipolyticus TaxID=1280370 RepID=A0ABW4ZSY4_9BACL